MESVNLEGWKTRRDEWQHLQVLDRDQLDRSTDCDLVFASQVLEAYFQSLPALLSSITDAIRCGNLKALRYHAHTVKGSSQAVGAQRVAAMCWALEGEDNLEEAEAIASHLNFGFCEVRALATRLGLWLDRSS